MAGRGRRTAVPPPAAAGAGGAADGAAPRAEDGADAVEGSMSVAELAAAAARAAATPVTDALAGAGDGSDAAAVAADVGTAGDANEVRLTGRWRRTRRRELAGGDEVVTGQVVARRPGGGTDAVDCALWPAQLRRRGLALAEDAQVEVHGALRQRFWRSGSTVASRTEVEVTSLREVG